MNDPDKQAAQSWFRQVSGWALANSIKLNADNTAAAMAKHHGGVFSPVPFGSTTQTTTTNKNAALIPTLTLSALALLGGGAGVAKLAGVLPDGDATPAAAQPVAPSEPDLQPKIVEGVIEWEFDPEAGFTAEGK